MSLASGGTIINATTESLRKKNIVWKNICMKTYNDGQTGLPVDVNANDNANQQNWRQRS